MEWSRAAGELSRERLIDVNALDVNGARDRPGRQAVLGMLKVTGTEAVVIDGVAGGVLESFGDDVEIACHADREIDREVVHGSPGQYTITIASSPGGAPLKTQYEDMRAGSRLQLNFGITRRIVTRPVFR